MRTVRPNHRKVSTDKRHELIQVFLHLGMKASEQLCIEYGVSPKYAMREAKEFGFSPRRPSRGGGDIAYTTDHNDPRWKIAIERGSVVA